MNQNRQHSQKIMALAGLLSLLCAIIIPSYAADPTGNYRTQLIGPIDTSRYKAIWNFDGNSKNTPFKKELGASTQGPLNFRKGSVDIIDKKTGITVATLDLSRVAAPRIKFAPFRHFVNGTESPIQARAASLLPGLIADSELICEWTASSGRFKNRETKAHIDKKEGNSAQCIGTHSTGTSDQAQPTTLTVKLFLRTPKGQFLLAQDTTTTVGLPVFAFGTGPQPLARRASKFRLTKASLEFVNVLAANGANFFNPSDPAAANTYGNGGAAGNSGCSGIAATGYDTSLADFKFASLSVTPSCTLLANSNGTCLFFQIDEQGVPAATVGTSTEPSANCTILTINGASAAGFGNPPIGIPVTIGTAFTLTVRNENLGAGSDPFTISLTMSSTAVTVN